jgi:lipopolysaccharide/colanic/teichoic acid biosynthesis glycosyltransferase
MTRAKRALDVVGAGTGIVVLSPLFLILALLIKADGPGPVFFRQVRVGYRGRLFRMWKFRSMVPDAEARGLPLTVGRDPRVTPVGAWLRRLRLDELPQLFNVVVGDMSLVGPRPEVPQYVASYGAEQRAVLDLVPGITDVASIRYLDEEALLATAPDPQRLYRETIAPEKIRLNLAYAAGATVWRDVGVIVTTLLRLFYRPNGLQDGSERQGDGEGEPRAPGGTGLHPEFRSHGADQLLSNGEPEPGA